MDPIGFSLENFDAVGQWRTTDEGAKIDPAGTFVQWRRRSTDRFLCANSDGQPDIFAGVFTEKLMIYALGRGVEYYDMPAVRAISATPHTTTTVFRRSCWGS